MLRLLGGGLLHGNIVAFFTLRTTLVTYKSLVRAARCAPARRSVREAYLL